MNGRGIGIIILLLVIASAIGFGIVRNITTEAMVIRGYVGGEKMGFFDDEEVRALLKKKYNIQVDAIKTGSYEMATQELEGIDFIFPSSQIALEYFKETNPKKTIRTERIFQSPIVIYSWTDIADLVVKQGMAKKIKAEHYTLDLKKFMDYIQVPAKKWTDIGAELYGSIKINCTDPNKSNSGNMYAGLLYQLLIDKGLSHDESLQQLSSMFESLGFMESSSGTLFESYLVKGKGANPLVVGYENQIVEFALENPAIWENAKGKVAVMVPEPTVWSEHSLVALTSSGEKLIVALSDPEILDLAWRKHGFRHPSFSNEGDSVVALPQTLDQIIEMPTLSKMKEIMNLLEQ